MTMREAEDRIRALERELAVKDQQVTELAEALELSREREAGLQLEVKRLLRQLYGPKSEAFKTHPDQLAFDEILAQAIEDAVAKGAAEAPDPETMVPDDETEDAKPPPKNRHNHGRRDLELLEGVPRVSRHHRRCT